MNLQESIKRIIKEETLKSDLIYKIKNDGWFDVSPYVGGDDNLKKITEIHNSLGFMKLFLDLNDGISEQDPLMRLYKNENGENVFVINTPDYSRDYSGNRTIYVNYNLIYRPLSLFLETNTNMKKREFLQKWFKDKYNIIVYEWNINYFSKDDNYMGGLI
jgi:hypothetical protein